MITPHHTLVPLVLKTNDNGTQLNWHLDNDPEPWVPWNIPVDPCVFSLADRVLLFYCVPEQYTAIQFWNTDGTTVSMDKDEGENSWHSLRVGRPVVHYHEFMNLFDNAAKIRIM